LPHKTNYGKETPSGDGHLCLQLAFKTKKLNKVRKFQEENVARPIQLPSGMIALQKNPL
jgi:hypothetical protein